MSYAAVQTLMTECTTAMAGGDYATALNKAMAAQVMLSILPDTTRQLAGGGQQALSWDRVAISNTIDRLQQLVNAKVGTQVSKVCTQPLRASGPAQLGIF